MILLLHYFQTLSTRMFNKGSNRKLKSVTIIHSATTETVRLPEDNNGVRLPYNSNDLTLFINNSSFISGHCSYCNTYESSI